MPTKQANAKRQVGVSHCDTPEPLNVLVWGHSDMAGGTELACVIARTFVEAGLPIRTVGIACPKTRLSAVEAFFKYEAIQIPMGNVFGVDESLHLATSVTGRVDSRRTYELLKQSPLSTLDRLNGFIDRQIALLGDRIAKHTLMISCGEPIAVNVAKRFPLRCVTITDHLLTATVRWVLQHGGLFDKGMADVLTRLEVCDRDSDEAFLAPPEFGGTDYDAYLAHGNVRCNYVGGLFYEAIPQVALSLNPSYVELKSKSGGMPVVFAFGGGGPVWLRVYQKLHDAMQSGASKGFALLVPTVAITGENISRKKGRTADGKDDYLYTLYTDGGARTTELLDPGRLMYWYAAAHLFVGRGGLAAQQIFATMMSDIQDVPEMLFIEEPSHPQIEHERESLHRLGFVHTRTLDEFLSDPMQIIKEVLSDMRPDETRERVRCRYGARMLFNVARALMSIYKPVGHLWQGGAGGETSARAARPDAQSAECLTSSCAETVLRTPRRSIKPRTRARKGKR